MPAFSLLGSNDLRSTTKRVYSPSTLLDNWYDARLDPEYIGRRSKRDGQFIDDTVATEDDPVTQFNKTGRCNITHVIQRQYKPSPLSPWSYGEPPLPHDKLGPYETIYEATYGNPLWRYKQPNIGPIFGYQDNKDRFTTTYRREFTAGKHSSTYSNSVKPKTGEKSRPTTGEPLPTVMDNEQSAVRIEKDKLTPTASLGIVKHHSPDYAPYLPIDREVPQSEYVPNFPYKQ